jgi:acetyl esterase
MPLDPQARRYLDAISARGLPRMVDQTPSQVRVGMRELSRELEVRDLPLKIENRTVPGPGGALPVRFYSPGSDGPLPVIVFFHGGGWVAGDLDTHDAVCAALAHRADAIVVSVDYRLAPEHVFPAAADDAFAATCWVVEEAATFGGDGKRVAVAGDSAGGNLAAVVCLRAREEPKTGPAIAAQVLVYPVIDRNFETTSYRECAEGYGLTRESMMWFWNLYVPDDKDSCNPLAAPLRAESLVGLPQALVVTAEFDTLRDEGEAYADRLEAADVPTQRTCYPGMIHGFFRHTYDFDSGGAVLDETASFLRRAFGARRVRDESSGVADVDLELRSMCEDA